MKLWKSMSKGLLLAIACLVVMYFALSAFHESKEAAAEPVLDVKMVHEIATTKRADLLLMKDGTFCMMRVAPWEVLGSNSRQPETLEVRMMCSPTLMNYGGRIKDWAPEVQEVIRLQDARYNATVGAMMKQFSVMTGGIIGGRGIPAQR